MLATFTNSVEETPSDVDSLVISAETSPRFLTDSPVT